MTLPFTLAIKFGGHKNRGRTDYNAGNKAQDIPSTHHHTKEFNAKFPVGRSTGDHIPGEYKP